MILFPSACFRKQHRESCEENVSHLKKIHYFSDGAADQYKYFKKIANFVSFETRNLIQSFSIKEQYTNI